MRNLFIITFLTSLFALPASAADLEISGTWFTKGNEAKIGISDCGDGTPCGELVWFKVAEGGITTDALNPDPALRTRSLYGSEVFWGFKKKKNKWNGGRIYDAQSGKTYKSKIELKDDGTLKVKGCVGPICQSQIWVRANDE